jgi:hypothetical protein
MFKDLLPNTIYKGLSFVGSFYFAIKHTSYSIYRRIREAIIIHWRRFYSFSKRQSCRALRVRDGDV